MTAPDESVDLSPGSPEAEGTLAERASSTIQADAVRGTWWTALQAVIGLPLAIVANLVVARSLGPHGYGVLASYITAYALILAVLNGGVSDATIQWGAAAYARGDRAELLSIARKCAGFHMIVEGPLGAIAAIVLLHRESVVVQLGGAIAVALTMAIGTTAVVLTATGRNGPLAKMNLVFGVALQASVVTAAVASHDAGPVWVARLGIGVVLSVSVLAIAPREVRIATLTPKFPWHWPTGFAKFSVRTLAAGLVTSLVFSRSELLVLDAYGLAAAAGLFALASGLAAQITAPIDAMLGPLVPAAAGLVEIGRERAAGAILRGIRLSVLGTAPIAAFAVPVVVLVAPVVYGSRFGPAGALFLALGLVSCLQSVLHPITAFVAALRIPIVVLSVNAAALAIDLVIVLALAPSLGATAAVVGNCVGQAVSLVVSVTLLRRRLGLPMGETLRAVLPFLGVAVVVASASMVGLALDSTQVRVPGAIVISVAIALAGSFVVLRICRTGVTERDLQAIVAGFPRLASTVVHWLLRIGLVRSEHEARHRQVTGS